MDSLFGNVAPTTRSARLRFLAKAGVVWPDNYESLRDVSSTMKNMVLSSQNPNTQATRIFHIIEFIKEVGDQPLLAEYTKLMDSIKKASIRKQNDTSTTDRAERYQIPLKDLQVMLVNKHPVPKFVERDSSISMIKAYQDYLLMAMYVLNPALRNDLHSLIIVHKAADVSTEGNYLVVAPRSIYLVLNEYKNSRAMGQVRIDLIDYVKTLIRNLFRLYKHLKLTPRSLFNHVSKAKVEPMSEDATKTRIKTVSKQYFGIPLSINDYRHLWEQSIQNSDEYKNMDLNDREAMHKKLLHSLNTALRYNRVK